MAKVRKEDKLPLKLKQLGKIYQLIEQFEEISRIDLSKLSRLAPATITALTRQLIDEKLIIAKGDSNNTQDEPIQEDSVIGKVVFIINNVEIWKKVFSDINVIIPIIITVILFVILISYKEKTGEKND